MQGLEEFPDNRIVNDAGDEFCPKCKRKIGKIKEHSELKLTGGAVPSFVLACVAIGMWLQALLFYIGGKQ